MKNCPHIKGTKREYIRKKRRSIVKARTALEELRYGSAVTLIFGGLEFRNAVREMDRILQRMDNITKQLL